MARGDRLSQILREGIRVRGATEGTLRPPAAATAGALAAFRPDFVLITVKAHATASAVRSLDPLGTRPIRFSLQNGLGNEEALGAGGYPVIGGVSNNGATLLESGEVFHAGLGEVIVSAFQNVRSTKVATLAAALSAVGFSVQQVADIRKPLWDKAILNAALNPVSALLGVRTGQLLRDSGSEHLLRLLVREAVAVARAEGFSTSEAEVWAMVQRIVARTSGNKTSMLQDLERGVRTEIDAMNGVIVTRASEHGIETPWNRLMLRLIRSRERG